MKRKGTNAAAWFYSQPGFHAHSLVAHAAAATTLKFPCADCKHPREDHSLEIVPRCTRLGCACLCFDHGRMQ